MPASFTSAPSTAQIQIPDGLEEFKVDDLNELSQLPAELSGIWEASPQGEEVNMDLRQRATQNIERATQLLSEIDEIALLRAEVDELERRVKSRYDRWTVAESEMHQAIEPFSELHLSRRMADERDASQAEGESLRTSLLEGEDVDIATFVREFRRRQQLTRQRHNSMRAIY